jgi:hypothetical protein
MRILLPLACALTLQAQDPFATQACTVAAEAALRGGKPEEARTLLVGGLTRDPSSTRLLARLLRLDRKQGRRAEAEVWASRLLDLGVDPGLPEASPELLHRSESLSRSEGRAEVAAVLPGAGQLMEGVAWEPRSGDLFLAVVNQRKILRRSRHGEVRVFAAPKDWAPIALAVDGKRGLLWAVGGVLEEMEGFEAKAPRRGVVAAFDLKGGRCVREASLEASAEHPRVPGDLLLHPDGTVYASDGAGGGVWRLSPGTTKLEPFIAEGRLASPQGMAWLPNGEMLLADYALGLFRVEGSGGLHPLPAPSGICLLGLDGLVAWKGAYYATQNGVAPSRLWRLGVQGDRVAAASVLRAHPTFGDPTLLAPTSQGLLLMANAQWDRFGAGGVAKGPTDPVVLLRIR